MPAPEKFENATVVCKANVYFDGRVVSHTIHLPGGARKSLGIVHPGTYTFKTAAPERMEIVSGSCSYKLDGRTDWSACPAGGHFDVPGSSSFDIRVEDGVAEYVCSFG